MHLLIVTWNGGGNINPLLALTARARASGWDVTVLAPASLAGRFGDVGAAFLARTSAREWDSAAMAEDVLLACEEDAPDVVLVDYMMPGAICGAERSSVPTVIYVHTLFGALLDGGAPAPITMAASLEQINELRRDLELEPVADFGELFARARRIVVTSPPELDLVPDPLPENVRYVGPVLEPEGSDEGWAPLRADVPLVVVCLGTTPMDEAPLLQRVLDALADEDLLVLATVGAHLDVASFTVPANATVVPHVRHAAVLPHASLVVTHAGLGTVLAALAAGVPLVCLPLGREQPDNAAAVERVGAGVALPPSSTEGEIRAAVTRVLGGGSYRNAAIELAESIRTAGITSPILDELRDLQ